ncbi:ABC transporter transmembrane domain-containing protein [Streptomyces sp. NPDC012623]|uniref:ABC transporter transmembrane domain-containing protein n=1 Tax=unclassified Streptomyces TaxID=2593676 RepID=UPI00368CA4D9
MSSHSFRDGTAPAPGSALKLLLRGIRRNRVAVARSFGLLAAWQLSEAMVPVVVGLVIDHAVAGGSVTSLALWGGVLVMVFASLMFTYRFGAADAYRVDQRENHRLRGEIAHHVLRPAGARTGTLSGGTLSLATSDTASVGGLARAVGYTFASAVAVLVSAAVLLRIDLAIGLAVLLGVPLVLAVIQFVTPVLSRRNRDQQTEIARTSGTAADLVRGLRVIKGIGAEDEAAARYRARSQVARAAGIRLAGSHGVMEGITTGLSGLLLAGVTLLAGKRALEGGITIGELVAIVGLTQFLAMPLQALGRVGAQVAAAHASAARIVDFLGTPPLLADGPEEPPPGPAPAVSLQDVTIGPLNGFTLTSRPGELLCLVVDDPVVTRTLMGLLAGEIHGPDITGEVLLDGVAIGELSLRARTARRLVNPHHTELLEGTLRSNLDPDSRHSDTDLMGILGAAAAQDIVGLDEQGLDQRVVPTGATYSGGQRQRIALARALAADPPALLLDNPTTAVDAVTEQHIARGISARRHGSVSTRTTWIVTTSPALLARAQRVVFVAGGRVVEEGTHRELLGRPAYQELVLR